MCVTFSIQLWTKIYNNLQFTFNVPVRISNSQSPQISMKQADLMGVGGMGCEEVSKNWILLGKPISVNFFCLIYIVFIFSPIQNLKVVALGRVRYFQKLIERLIWRCLTHSDRLDNLEHGWSTNHKKEETHQPRSNWVLFIGCSRGFWNISPQLECLLCLLIRNFHPLVGSHCAGKLGNFTTFRKTV